MSFMSLKQLNSSIPKYKQIVASVENAILNGNLKKNDKLPSLNSLRDQHKLSRDTVISAFKELRSRGIIYAVVGKGYYVQTVDINVQVKVLLLFDELNAFKEDLYNSLIDHLGPNFQVDLFFHHFNYQVFSKLIHENTGNYGCYVVMPANLKNVSEIIRRLPTQKTYILDQVQEGLKQYPSIYQNFEKYIFEGLTEVLKLINSYNKLILIHEKSKQPDGIKIGFELFCNKHGLVYEVLDSVKDRMLRRGEIYFTLSDRDLIIVIKKLKQTSFQLGKDVGVISYNDSPIKEILEGGITTISADFNFMGSQLAKMLKENTFDQIETPKKITIRNSL